MDKINNFFKIKERGSTFRVEVIAGLVTFLAMVYILPVNAGMLSDTGMPYGGVFLATAIAAIIATMIMGIWANYPVALASGMGVNAFFAYTVASEFGYGLSWEEALSTVLIAGILFLIVSLTGLRRKIINAIPKNLKYAVGAGIGFFIAFIGLKNSGIIGWDQYGATFVQIGDFGKPATILAIFGLLVAIALIAMKNKVSKFAIIIAILVTAVVGLIVGLILKDAEALPRFQTGDGFFSYFKELGSIKDIFAKSITNVPKVVKNPTAWIIIFTFLFVDFFDTAGTLMAVGTEAGLVDENGELVDGEKALLADSVGTVAGAVLGTSTVTSFVESGTGIESGGRTGLASVVTALLFGLAILLYPIFGIIAGSPAVTAMALIVVGGLMAKQLKFIDWDDIVIAIPAFITIIFMLLTFSIAEGIAAGFIVYVITMVASKRYKEVHPIMYGLGALFVAFFVLYGLDIIKLH